MTGNSSGAQRTRRRAAAALFFIIPIGFTGCAYDSAYYGPPPYTQYYPDYSDYYYYPSASAYFHFDTGYYYYRDHDRWVHSRVLPPNIRIDSRDRVKIRIPSDKPYLKFPDHQRQYKSKPGFRPDEQRSKKEREANRTWYQKFEQIKEKREKEQRKKKEKPRDSDRKKPYR